MKNKFLLIFLLGIFLISFTNALSTIVIKPLDSPINVMLTNTSGTIPAGNYSIVLVHMGNVTGYTSTPMLCSPPTNPINITLWETGGIIVNWTNSTNPWALGSNIYIRNISNNNSGMPALNNPWQLAIPTGYGKRFGEGYIIRNWTVSSYASQPWMNDSSTPNPSMPFGLNTTGGVGLVYLTGTSGTYYLSDIVRDINNSYGGTLPNTIVWDGFDRFYGTWTIAIQNSTTSGVFDISGATIWLWGGYYNPGYPLQLRASANTYNPTIWQSPPTQGSAIFTYWGNASLNNTIIGSGTKGMDTDYMGSMQEMPYSNTDIWNSIIMISYPRLIYQRTYWNSKLYAGDVLGYYYGGKDRPIEDLTIMTGSYRWGESFGNNDTYLKRFTSQVSCSSQQINMRFLGVGINKALYLIDYNLPNCAGIFPYVYWYTTTYSPTGLYLGNSVNVKVIDINGMPIEDANVTMIYNNGEILFTQLTNSSGQIPEQYAIHHVMNRTGLTNGYTNNITEFTPFNFTIIKSGYNDYLLNNLNFSKKQDWIISLTPQNSLFPASLVLDKIISLNEITNETISYNITLRITNKGGSNSTSTNITDIDSEYSPYNIENITNNTFTAFSYLKNFTRNSTTYSISLSQAQSIGIDSSTSNIITANSTLIDLIVPSAPTGQQLTLIKNVYYNSENSTHVNYTLSVEVVNSGGEDLTGIILLDTDLNLNEIRDLNRTLAYNLSNFTIIEKAASNTNKLFDKSSATVNTFVYQSNQIQVRIPGYGGPADAIVYSPLSVTSSTDFDTIITVRNMNPDIGQDFTIDYWVTDENETLNYSSGQQTIYVPYSGESNLTATLISPTEDGNYKLKALVTWVGGTASAYSSFLVNTPIQPSSNSHSPKSSILTTNAISPIQEVICNTPYIRYGLECCLDKNNNSICDNHEVTDTLEENISQENEQISQEETLNTSENTLLKRIKESFTKLNNLSLIFILGSILFMIIAIIYLIKRLRNINQIEKRDADSRKFKKLEKLSAYNKLGQKIGNIKGVYLDEKSKEIYGWAIELDENIAKSMNFNDRNFFIKQGDYKIA